MNHLFGTCVYDELDPTNLLIIISKDQEEVMRFDHKDPLVSWFEFMKWYINQQNIFGLVWSSSRDHWFFDTEGYFEKFFDPETGEFIDWRALEMYDVEERYPRCVVNSEMKNFWELKEYVKKIQDEKI